MDRLVRGRSISARLHRQFFIVTRTREKTQVGRAFPAALRKARKSYLSDHRNTTGLAPALDAPRELFTTRDGVDIAYYADRAGGGNPLLLVHSINAAPSAIEMKPLFEHYRAARPVYVPDLPGFGASDRGDREYTPAFFADALCEFIAALAGPPADVVALSLSCEFAARAAAAAPQLFRTLTLISPTGFGNRQPPSEQASRRIVRLLRNPLLGPALFGLLTSKPSIRYFLNLSFVERAPDELVDYAWQTSHRRGARNAPTAFVSGRLFAADAVRELYQPLALPVMVLYDQDPNISFDRLPQLVDSRPNWQAVRISPSRGLPHFEHPAAVARELDRFWALAG